MKRLSSELIAAVLDHMPLGLVVAHPDGEIRYVNRAFFQILDRDEVPAVPLSELVAAYRLTDRQGRPYPVEQLPLRRAFAARGPVVVDDIATVSSTGRLIFMRAFATPIFGIEPVADDPLVVMAFTDISDEVRAEEARKSVERQLAFAVGNAPIILWMHDREGRITLSEGAGLAALGVKPGEMVGGSVFDLYRDQPDLLHNVQKVLDGQSLTTFYETSGVSLQSHLAPVRDAAGRVEGVIGLATNVTESRRLEEQLFQSQKMEAIGRLSGGIAHDFNNLLGAIQGFAWVCQQRLKSSEPARQDLAQIQSACDRGAALVRQLLALGRRQRFKLEVLELPTLVADVERMLRPMLGEDVELRTRIEPDVGRIRVDAGEIERVLMNLVVNAREAMPAGGVLSIEVGNQQVSTADLLREPTIPPGSYVVITVSDTGVGMDATTRTRMFEPFFTTKEKGSHSGLGLASVYGIVQQSQGHLAVTSESGRGTSVRIFLPRTDAVPEAEAATRPPGPGPGGHETVLVVEDDQMLLHLLAGILRSAGYLILEAANAGEALLVAEQHPADIHLLLTDVVMPRVNGVELASRIRRARPGLRVAFMSGYADDVLAQKGAGSDKPRPEVFIEKPFRPETLLRQLRALLDAPGASA